MVLIVSYLLEDNTLKGRKRSPEDKAVMPQLVQNSSYQGVLPGTVKTKSQKQSKLPLPRYLPTLVPMKSFNLLISWNYVKILKSRFPKLNILNSTSLNWIGFLDLLKKNSYPLL